MIVTIDEEKFWDAGLQFEERLGLIVFQLPTPKPDVYETVIASSDGTNVTLFPERSSAHKRLLALLG